MNGLPEWIDRFSELRVLVLGEAMLDAYLRGTAHRISREAPVPVVTLRERAHAPGGAANASRNLATLGASVTLLSVVGDDEEGRLLRRELETRGIDTEHVIASRSRRTATKNRVVADGQVLLRVDDGTTDHLEPADEGAVVSRLDALHGRFDATLVSDYGCGLVTPAVLAALARLQATQPRLVVADARDLRPYAHVGVTAVKPNYPEAVALLGERELDEQPMRLQQIAANGERLLGLAGARVAAVTLDAGGALVFEAGSPPYRTYARPTRESRAAGAGDTFAAALTLGLAAGAGTPVAAELASAAAAVVVGKDGTAECSLEELRRHFLDDEKFVYDRERLSWRVNALREEGRRIVFTNGCFDILHRGHITYLARAKALGDFLIVGVNSDESVRRLKGSGRPINSLEDRAQVLAALSCIDLIAPFAEDTADELIDVVRPDVFVKGGDYTRERVPEADHVERLGGSVRILPYVEDRSTTGVIDRIRRDADLERPIPGASAAQR